MNVFNISRQTKTWHQQFYHLEPVNLESDSPNTANRHVLFCIPSWAELCKHCCDSRPAKWCRIVQWQHSAGESDPAGPPIVLDVTHYCFMSRDCTSARGNWLATSAHTPPFVNRSRTCLVSSLRESQIYWCNLWSLMSNMPRNMNSQ